MQPRQRRRAQEAAQYAPRIAGQPADKKAPRLTSNCPHRQACKGSKERWHASPSRTGKTTSIAHETIRARETVLGERDQLVFFMMALRDDNGPTVTRYSWSWPG
ncbi:hypothetical protein WJX73_005230 [Symbiochloris irregularis]|uniref:Uncharacterized protein n=1 Tax=Symbiochloris irregularis TaxID=706552 RepID=A0AAW1NTI2_9CHLO